MKNSEKEYDAERKAGNSLIVKTNEDYNKRKPNPVDPNETKGKPDKVLPIIDKQDTSDIVGLQKN